MITTVNIPRDSDYERALALPLPVSYKSAFKESDADGMRVGFSENG